MIKNKKKQAVVGKYLVVPLNLTDQPFATDNIEAHRNTSHYIVDFDVIKAYENTTSSDKCIDLKFLIASHVDFVKKIAIRNMGKFGDGAFSKSAIPKGLRLIYSGLVTAAPEVPDASNHYAFQMIASKTTSKAKEISVNGDYNRCESRYLQHLPKNDLISDGDKKSSFANCKPTTIICTVRFNGKRIFIPFIALESLILIEANKLIGFDYGIGYWSGRNLVPTYFTEDGVPLNSYRIHCREKLTNTFAQSISVIGLNGIAEQGYFINGDEVTLFPPESLKHIKDRQTLLTTGTLLIEVPAIIKFAIHSPGQLYSDSDGEYIFLLPLNHSNYIIDPFIANFAKFESTADGETVLSLNLNRIIKLSYGEWVKAAEFINNLLKEPMRLYVSMYYSDLTLPLIVSDEALPLYSLTQTSFFKKIANNFNDRSSALEVTMRTPRI